MKAKKIQDIYEIAYRTPAGKWKRCVAASDKVPTKVSQLRDRGCWFINVSSQPVYTQEVI
jgi:hypothetical protein